MNKLLKYLTACCLLPLLLTSCIAPDPLADSSVCVNTNSYRIDAGQDCIHQPTSESVFEVKHEGDVLKITFNYIPPHATRGQISARERTFSVSARPEVAADITPVANTGFAGPGSGGSLAYIFGIAVTGVPFDPVANEPWVNTSNGTLNFAWNLEVLSLNAGLNYDCNNAHDLSRYHYHGSPLEYLKYTEDGSVHSALLGYAADGFPIYYKYAFEDPNDLEGPVVELHSSYTIQEGCRPGDGVTAPDGPYDGTYVADYAYDATIGELDECNGRWCKTPEYPEGTYAYFITDEFPSVPRYFRGTPSADFKL